MMHHTARMEQFNIAVVRAIASACGFNTAKLEVDDDSVDIEICAKYPFELGKASRSRVAIQLKATSSPQKQGGYISFTLDRKNYDDLRICDSDPRYLFVLELPKKCSHWIRQKKKFCAFKYRCYWLSLQDFNDLPDGQGTKTVKIPTNQIIDIHSLPKLLDSARMGETYVQQ